MEIASAPAGEATKSILSHLEREIGYLVRFNRNVQNLRTKIVQLTATRDDVQRLIDAAKNNNQVIRESVQTWLRRVEIVREEATQLSDDAGLVNNWFKGWCCDRFSLGRKADKMNNLIIQALLDERNTFGDIVADPKPIQSYEIVSGGDFDAFASRESTMKEIVEALKDGNIGLIGVFGMPGVGKTMLLEAVYKNVKKENIFDEVVMVIVSQNPDLEKIQDNIAKRLDLRFDAQDDSVTKKEKLNARINCSSKKTLVVLDDVWERLEIAQVGILHKDCKVVFVTRFQGVCSRMESDVSIEVTTLTAEDSWQLFRKRAGDAPPHNSILPGVAKDIANECKGLPLAIATLGRALRDKDETVWNSALLLLKKSNFAGMSPVISSIEMSYDFLGSEEMKTCFLFCCLYPEDYKIDTNNIFLHVMGEKLLRNADTFLEARSMFHLIVDELVSSCLLLRDVEGYVMLHDVVRDVAISIASAGKNRFIVKAGMNLTEWPDVELGNCNRLSLVSNNITCLPLYQIEAPNLLTLSLNDNLSIREIPLDFFVGMQNLTTLDLSETGVKSLPPSFWYLRSLRVLRMDNCRNLVDISRIDSLDSLEIVSFRDSNKIQSLESLGKLTTLKMLDLSIYTIMGYPLEKLFLPKVISNLHRLEELRIIGRIFKVDEDVDQSKDDVIQSDEDGIQSDGNVDQSNVGLSEITYLTRLTCLHMNLFTDECYSQEVLPSHWGNLPEFLFVCHSWNFVEWNIEFLVESWNLKKRIFLQLPSISVPNWIPKLLGWTNCLFLDNCHHLKSVDQLDPSGMFDNLKVLSIKRCDSMTHLYSTASSVAKAPMYAFRNLERLELNGLDKLVAFCDGTLPQGFFQNLKSLKVEYCYNVIILIPWDLLERLQNLEILKVSYVASMDKLVQLTTNATQSMSSSGPSFPIFPKLRELHIWRCSSLNYLLPMRVLQELGQLEILEIYNSQNMWSIVEGENYEEDKVLLPRLKRLHLYELINLKVFCDSRLFFDWPALEYLRVYGCQMLMWLPLHTNSVPKLRTLDVDQQWFDQLQWKDESLKSRLQPLVMRKHN